MIQLSHSKLNVYRMCPYKYSLLEQMKKEKVKPIVPVNNRRYVDGWVAHMCLELWCRKGFWAKDWMQNVMMEVIVGTDGKNHYSVVGISSEGSMITTILNQYLKENNVVWKSDTDKQEVEAQLKEGLDRIQEGIFNLELNHPFMETERWFKVAVPNTNVLLAGRTDLIDKRFPDVYDMKWTTCENVDWDQLLLYDLAVTIKDGKKVRRVGTFTPLMPEISIMRENTQEELDYFVEELRRIEGEINAGTFELKGAAMGKCGICEVYEECKASIA